MKHLSKRVVGSIGESIAKRFLMKHGYEYISSNFYSQYGEIDLIFKVDDTLCFIEVKTVRVSCENVSRETYLVEEMFTDKKYSSMIETINEFLLESSNLSDEAADCLWRIDYVIVYLNLIKNNYRIRWYKNYF